MDIILLTFFNQTLSNPLLDLFMLGLTIGGPVESKSAQPTWRWLLWPQVAIVLLITQMAYLDILPNHLLQWPLADKVLHFVLFGAVVFWLNIWLEGRAVHLGGWTIPLAILIPFTLAALEEGLQAFSSLRSAGLDDLLSDLAGMVVFWWLSQKVGRQVSVKI